MLISFSVIFFILGLAIGSFLNVIAHRSVHGGSIFFGSSKCPKCKHKLAVGDLIPVVSFIALKGNCRYCGKKISPQYPFVELATGVAFASIFVYWWRNTAGIDPQNTIFLLFLLFFVSTLIVLFTADIVDGLLPNSVILPAIAVAALYKVSTFLSGSETFSGVAVDVLAAFIAAFGFFAIVYFSGEKAMGGGDVKLVFLIGLALGWPSIIFGLFVSFLTGAFVAVMLILTGKKRFGQTIPFGPFLTVGAVISLFLGKELIDLYLRAINA
jgi:leader peptidase (prepilin peptidase)/N-methyltransferase